MVLLAGAGAGAIGGGWAALAIGIVVFLLAAPRGTLVVRCMVLLVLECALLNGAGLVGPMASWAFSPPALGAVSCLPAAVVLAVSAPGAVRRLPRVPVDDVAVLLVGLFAALLLAKPLIGGSDVARLRMMTLGGADFAAHFDYVQNVWFHKGFLFVNGGHRILEPRPNIAAAPHGVHVAFSALGMLLTGRSALPSPMALLRLFGWFNVLVDTALVVALTGMTARLLRCAGVRPGVRTVAVLLTGSVAVVGAIGTLYVWGFVTFTAGLTATVVAVLIAATAKPAHAVAEGAVVTAAVVDGCLTYTLMVPVLILAFGLFLWRTRSLWRARSRRSRPFAAYLAVVAGALAFGIVPILPSSSAVGAGGGVTAPPLGLIVLVGLGTVIIALGARLLPSSIRQLTGLSLVIGALTLAFAADQLVTQGHVRYYGIKVVYVWLGIALVAFVAQLACLLDAVITRNGLRLRTTGVLAVAGLLAVTGAGYIGPGTPPPLIRPGGATPLVVKWVDAPRYEPRAAREELAAGHIVLRALRVPGARDRLLWGPGVLLPVHNRWLAVLNRSWNARSDSLLARLLWFHNSVTWQLTTWLRDNRNGSALTLLVTKTSWLRRAQRAVADAGVDYVQIKSLPDSATYQVPPTTHHTS